jgi:hypothetical protein
VTATVFFIAAPVFLAVFWSISCLLRTMKPKSRPAGVKLDQPK